MGIEEMFRDFKLGGYNLESTQVSNHRLIALILLITLAYCFSTFSGQSIKQKGVAKYVARPTEPKRAYRRHSSFSIGLHGQHGDWTIGGNLRVSRRQNWVDSSEFFHEVVQELSRFSTDKNDYYRRGMRLRRLFSLLYNCLVLPPQRSLKQLYQDNFTSEYAIKTSKAIAAMNNPLLVFDVGGKISDENWVIMSQSTHAVILVKTNQGVEQWQIILHRVKFTCNSGSL